MGVKQLQVLITGDAKGAMAAFEEAGAGAGGWGEKIKAVTTSSAFVMAAGGAAIGAALYKVGSDFDDAYDKIRTNTGVTGPALEGLKEDFKAVVANVPASFGDASNAISTINQKLGLTGQPLQALSSQMLELSRITSSDLGTNVSAVTGLLNQFGIGAQDQGAKLDELFRTYQATGVSVGDLASQMSAAGPQLQALGLNFDQSAALLGSLGKAGLDVGDVMPAMSKAMATAAKEGKDAGTVFNDTFAAIRTAPDDTSAAGIALQVFGAKAGPKFAELIRSGQLSYGDLMNTIQGGSDTILSASADTMDFKEKFELMKNKAFVALEPIASEVFGLISEGMGFITDHASIAIPLVLGLAGAFVAWQVATKAWAAATEVGTAIQWAFNAAMDANPITLVVIAIAALAAAAVWAFNNVQWFHDGVVAAWDGIKIAAQWAWDNVLHPVFDAIVDSIVNYIVPAAITLWGWIQTAWEGISNAVSWAWNNVIQPVWNLIYSYIVNILIPYYQLLWAAAQNVWDGISTAVSAAWNNVIQPVWNAISSYITTYLIPYYQQLWNVAQTVWGGISTAVSWAWNNVIQPVWNQIQNVINGVLIPAFQVAQTIIGAVWSGISLAISGAWNTIQTVFGWLSSAIDGIKAAFSGIADTVHSVFGGLAGIVSGAFQGVKDAWNDTVGGKGISIPSVFGFGGADFTIPRLHTGGTFSAPMAGGEGLALLRDGEVVNTPGGADLRGAGGQVAISQVVNIQVVQTDGEDQMTFARRVRSAFMDSVRIDGPLPNVVVA